MQIISTQYLFKIANGLWFGQRTSSIGLVGGFGLLLQEVAGRSALFHCGGNYNWCSSGRGNGGGGGAVVASITSTTAVSNAAITTKTQPQTGNGPLHRSNGHAQSSGHLPDIKLNASDKYGSMQKIAVRSKITSSVSDLESVQQYSLHRIYGTAGNNQSSAARKQLIGGSGNTNSSSKYGMGMGKSSSNHSASSTTISQNISSSHHNALSNSMHHHSQHHHHPSSNNNGVNGSNNNNMSHSQSTGDVSSAIFGRAWLRAQPTKLELKKCKLVNLVDFWS